MIGLAALRLALVVGCPRCRATLMPVMDECGRGTEALEVHGYDLAESTTPGFWNLKWGWIVATPHHRPIPPPGSSGSTASVPVRLTGPCVGVANPNGRR